MSRENAPLLVDPQTPNEAEDEEPQREAGIGSSGGRSHHPHRGSSASQRLLFPGGRPGKFTQLEIVLATASVILLVLMSVFAGLYARGRASRGNDTPPPIIVPAPPESSQNACLTTDCVLTAANILSDMDQTVNPCDDFFEYTCGGWTKKNVIPDDKGRYSYFDILYSGNQKILRNILENEYVPPSSSNDTLPPHWKTIDQKNFYKLQTFYSACMNESVIESKGVSPIIPYLIQIDEDFPVDRQFSLINPLEEEDDGSSSRAFQLPRVEKAKFTKVLSYLYRLGVYPLFRLQADADSKNPEVNVLHGTQAGLGLPSKEYYLEEENLRVYRAVIGELLAKSIGLVYARNRNNGDPVKDALYIQQRGRRWEMVADLVVEFEKKLSNITLPHEYFSDPDRAYNPRTLNELSQLAPQVEWEALIKALLPPQHPLPERVIIHNADYFARVSKLVASTPAPTLQVYLIWNMVRSYADQLSDEFQTPLRKLRARLKGVDADVKPKRWETCLKLVDRFIGISAGRYYVQEAFGGESKRIGDDIILSIKKAFVDRLPQLDWLDDETRERAIGKVDYLIQKVGYSVKSPNTTDPISLAKYYGKLDVEEARHFENVVAGKRWDVERLLARVGEKVDRDEWHMTPQTVNAYYNPTGNEIVFPAGILQPPFFSAKDPEYLNYGSIGVVVGHELTHGFDSMGRKYDRNGRLTQWWTEGTVERFTKLSQCFVDQYSNFTVPNPGGGETHVNGMLTLGENLADNGGLKEAFSAWKARYSRDPDQTAYLNQLLPGLEHLSREQLFYVAFGRIWCAKIRPEAAVERIRTDPHSPPRWRVNGPLQNSDHFAEVWKCPAGSRMNPVNKCSLW